MRKAIGIMALAWTGAACWLPAASAHDKEYTQQERTELEALESARDQLVQSYVHGVVRGADGEVLRMESIVAEPAAGEAEQPIDDFFHEEATFGGTLQPFWLEGSGAISDLWRRYFSAWPQRDLKFRQPTVRFYGDNVSVETGYMEMYMSAEARSVITHIRYSITRVKTEKGWQIVNMHVSRLPGTE